MINKKRGEANLDAQKRIDFSLNYKRLQVTLIQFHLLFFSYKNKLINKQPFPFFICIKAIIYSSNFHFILIVSSHFWFTKSMKKSSKINLSKARQYICARKNLIFVRINGPNWTLYWPLKRHFYAFRCFQKLKKCESSNNAKILNIKKTGFTKNWRTIHYENLFIDRLVDQEKR